MNRVVRRTNSRGTALQLGERRKDLGRRENLLQAEVFGELRVAGERGRTSVSGRRSDTIKKKEAEREAVDK